MRVFPGRNDALEDEWVGKVQCRKESSALSCVSRLEVQADSPRTAFASLAEEELDGACDESYE